MKNFGKLSASIKHVRTKLRKIDPLSPLSTKCPHWLNPPPSCPCRHTIDFEISEVFSPKVVEPLCPQDVRTEQSSFPLTADVFYGQPLIGLIILRDVVQIVYCNCWISLKKRFDLTWI